MQTARAIEREREWEVGREAKREREREIEREGDSWLLSEPFRAELSLD